MSNSPDSELTAKALRLAYESRGRPKGLMFHSDQGCHYTSLKFRQTLWRFQITQSMSRRGNCWDTETIMYVAGSFFHRFKYEFFHHEDFEIREETEQAIFETIEIYYNRQRKHSNNGYLAPLKFEEVLTKTA